MRAVVYDRPGSFEITEVPDPHPGQGEVRLRVLLAGVCGTDVTLHRGGFDPAYPLTPGHEVVGEVDEVGPGVDTLEVGQRVALDNQVPCGLCRMCQRGVPVQCVRLVAQGVSVPGGFAEHVVALAAKCHPVDDLEPELAVLAEPTACVVHGLDLLALRPGSDVLVLGAGPTGLILTQLLRAAGAFSVTVAAPTPAKLALATRLGADATVLLDRDRPEETVERLGGPADPRGNSGFDVVVDATGAAQVLQQTIALTRTRGTVFVYGMPHEGDRWAVSAHDVFRRELTIKGSCSQMNTFDRAVQALRTGRVRADEMITHRFRLEEYGAALAAVSDHACVKAVVAPA